MKNIKYLFFTVFITVFTASQEKRTIIQEKAPHFESLLQAVEAKEVAEYSANNAPEKLTNTFIKKLKIPEVNIEETIDISKAIDPI